MKPILAFLTLVCLLTACNSGKKFTSRKYMSGRYVSHTTHKERNHKKTYDEKTDIAVQTIVKAEREMPASPVLDKAITASADVSKAGIKSGTRIYKKELTEKARILLEKNTLLKGVTDKTFKKLEYKNKPKASKAPGAESLLSVLLSGAGIILNVVSLVLTLVFEEYIFLALLALGLVFGIFGLVLGIQGIKRYRREKSNGNRNTSTLVLGIIGTALGGAAIFTALYFCLVSIFLLSF